MVLCEGIEMYDPRDTIKAEAAETIHLGDCVRIASDGKAYVVDNGKSDVCHGVSLEAAVAGDKITILTRARMYITTSQTAGARIYTGAVSGGSAPSTTLSGGGIVCGFAISTHVVYFMAPTPAANG